eukprot:1192154-Prorocentrum_minimum.AAC.1
MFSRRTNRTHEARVYSRGGPIGRTCASTLLFWLRFMSSVAAAFIASISRASSAWTLEGCGRMLEGDHGFTLHSHGFTLHSHGFTLHSHGFSLHSHGFTLHSHGFTSRSETPSPARGPASSRAPAGASASPAPPPSSPAGPPAVPAGGGRALRSVTIVSHLAPSEACRRDTIVTPRALGGPQVDTIVTPRALGGPQA